MTTKTGSNRTNSKLYRLKLYYVQNSICHYCFNLTPYASWTVDHKVPKIHNGLNKFENLVGCCYLCNINKGAKNYDIFINKYMYKVDEKLIDKRNKL